MRSVTKTCQAAAAGPGDNDSDRPFGRGKPATAAPGGGRRPLLKHDRRDDDVTE